MSSLRQARLLSLLLGTLGVLLSSCGAPLFLSDDELHQPEPELIEYLLPYLESWSSKSWEEIRDEVRQVEEESSTFFSIGIRAEYSVTGDPVTVIVITLDNFEDWSRGYFYIPDGSTLQERPGLRLRHVDNHFYLFSHNL